MLDEKEYQTLLLAALLHDIGKFWQRTQEQHSTEYDSFTQKDYGQHGAHAKWSANFVERYLPEQWRGSGSIVVYHHNPQDRLSRIVSIADHLSASERERDLSSDVRQLRSIFTEIRLGEDFPAPAQDYYYPLSPLSINNGAIFPSKDSLPEKDCTQAYLTQWKEFTNEAQSLMKLNNFSLYFSHTYNLLYKYTWCIPSAGYRAIPDIPLFDHSRTTCAIAACLWLTNPTDADLSSLENSPAPRFLLIGGDLSGIQSYLYDIANIGTGGVAKRLRARSFYLSCLVEVTAHRLLHSLVDGFHLPLAANIMSSGGKFVLLAPKLPEVEQNLDSIDEKINHWLFRQFQGELTLLFAKVPLSPQDFTRATIASRLAELEDALNCEKNRKLSRLLSLKSGGWNSQQFLIKEKYPSGECPSCQRMPARAPSAEEPEKRFCPQCVQDRTVGEELPLVSYMAYSKGQDQAGRQTGFTFYDDEPYHVTLATSQETIPGSPYLVEAIPGKRMPCQFPALFRPLANYVPRFQSEDQLNQLCQKCADSKECQYEKEVRQRLTNYHKPLYSFQCIAAASRDARDGELYGSQLLGVLKGDVDRLGFIFSHGFEWKFGGASFSRLAALSRQLDLFFSGWLDYTVSTSPDFRECYTVYSGGDDFLFVGPWHRTIQLADHINGNFTRFVADNPSITLSIGIAVTKPKFPIAKSSIMANDLLGQAKATGRERLRLFGVTVPWRKHTNIQVDFSDLKHWAELLKKSLDPALSDDNPEKLSTAFVHRLLGYARQCRAWRESQRAGKPDVRTLLYLSHLAYDIARNIKNKEVKSEVREELIKLTDLQNSPLMSQLHLPITWALLSWRR